VKSNYWNKRSPEGDWDTIVIGSGMGGMTSAALLSELGHRVLVLEQHYVPGGFTHVFKRKGWTWDVGVHAVGEVTEHTMTGRLLARLTKGRLRWNSLGPSYDQFHYPDDFTIDFPDSPERYRETLVEAFPEEVEAIDRYFALVRETAGAMKGYYLSRALPSWLAKVTHRWLARPAEPFFQKCTADVVAELTDNPKLRTILTAQWGYYGSVPSRSSFAIQALVVKHFLHGGYYPVGGSEAIAVELLRTVAESGGWTRIQADVEEIVIEKNRACGVRLTTGEVLRAKQVISAAGLPSTIRKLLPESLRKTEWAQSVSELPPASAHVCLYLGFEGDISSAGASAANQWFCSTWSAEEDVWSVDGPEPLDDAPILYCSFPSLKHPDYDPGPEQRHTGEVVTFVPWSSFEPWLGSRWKRRGQDYDAFKKRIEESLLRQFFAQRPELEPMLRYSELSTPLSTDHFCRPTRGSIYGLEPTPERFANPWLRPRSPVDGLFFGGSDVATVGVIGAMIGGVLAALSVEPWKGLRYMRRL
jgi:all-trans-retinol 13,14-reductase